MLSGGEFITFIGTIFLFGYIPGPAMLYSTAQTIARGKRSGFIAALGVHVGGYFHVILAAAGLSVLLQAMPTVYIAVKLFGAAYLIWIGLNLIFQQSDKGRHSKISEPQRSSAKVFVDSIIVDVLNPKTAVFFVAFLPQFVHVSGNVPVWAQFLILGALTNLVFSSADFVSVLLAHNLVRKLDGSSIWKGLVPRIGGGILVALGVRLLVADR